MTTRRLAASCGFLLVLSVAGAAQGQQSITGTVVGYLWSANNSPIAGGQVYLRDVRSGVVAVTGRTTEAGEFRFTNVPPGQYVVEYVTPGGGTITAVGKPFTLAAGETVATFVRMNNAFPVIVPAKEPQVAAKPDPRDNVETAVVFAIRLLEAGDHKMFLSQFVPPEQLKTRAGSPEALNAMAEGFSGRADRLLAAFKYIRTQKPTYDEAKTTATFPLDGQPDAPSTSLTFVKIGQYWYLANR